MTPTVLRIGELRFLSFSREERRLHVHVQSTRGEAKFWLDPTIEIAEDHGLGWRDLVRARRLIREHEAQIRAAWRAHFGC
jgi:hypothetical protein